ncbi:MAG: DUF1579 family protein [Planctomycetota bacterium]
MSRIFAFLAGVAVTATLTLGIGTAFSQDGQEPSSEEMAKMMLQAEKYTKPGPHHEWLGQLVGSWESETRLFMGNQATPPEKGTTEISWLMEGRFLKMEGHGSLMGMPMDSFYILGYDNFKQSYVTCAVNSIETALRTSEGDIDPRTGALIAYGTIDEYLTGEHDKMVKYVYRLPSPDKLVIEVHDLPIGETGTKVIEMTFNRKK